MFLCYFYDCFDIIYGILSLSDKTSVVSRNQHELNPLQVPPIDSASTEGARPDQLTGNVEFRNVKFRYPARPEVVVSQRKIYDTLRPIIVGAFYSEENGMRRVPLPKPCIPLASNYSHSNDARIDIFHEFQLISTSFVFDNTRIGVETNCFTFYGNFSASMFFWFNTFSSFVHSQLQLVFDNYERQRGLKFLNWLKQTPHLIF